MDYPSIAILTAAVSTVVYVIFKAKRNDALTKLSDVQLLQESFFDGSLDNMYSKEYARRQKAKASVGDMS